MRKPKPKARQSIPTAKPARNRRSAEQMLLELKQRLREISDLTAAGDILTWDQATYMPRGGADARARQCAALYGLAHEQAVAPALGKLLDALEANGTGVASLAAAQASPALRKTIEQLAGRTQTLLEQSRPFAGDITDRRLALEVGVIQTLAESLAVRLARRDPLSERVHHHPVEAIGLALRGGLGVGVGWLGRIGRHKQPRLGDRQG